MPTQQSFLAAATEKAAADLAKAFVALPEDKRLWQPAESARSAMDQVAECAILTGYIANLLHTRQYGNYDMFYAEEVELVRQGWEEIHPRLIENAGRAAAAIAAVPDGDLPNEIELPWGMQSIDELLAYSYWNLTYHLGQVNYIASLLGPLY